MNHKRFALFLIAVAIVGYGVISKNLTAIGLGLLLTSATFFRLPDTVTLPPIASPYLLIIGAILLAVVNVVLIIEAAAHSVILTLWIASIAIFITGAVKLDRMSSDPQQINLTGHGFWRRHGLLIPIILVAFALRIYSVETLPPMHGDEGEMGLAALTVLDNQAPPFNATGWLDHPALFHYLQAIPVALFGRTALALRLLSVIAGVLCVPLLYQLGRRGWGPIAGLVAAWLLAVSHLHIHFSRIGLNNIESTLAMLLFLVLLAHFKRQRVTMFVLSGLVVGFAQYMYFGSRLIILVAAVILFFTWQKKMVDSRQIMAFSLGVVIMMAPLFTFFIARPDTFANRTNTVFILTEKNLKHTLASDQATLSSDLLPLLREQVTRNLNFFVRDGDNSSFYIRSIPSFDMLTSILFWLGLGLVLTRLGRYNEFSVVSWLGLGVLVGGVLTNDAPYAPRLLIAVPAVFLLGGILIQRVARLLSAYPKAVRVLGLVVLLGVTGFLNVKAYFFDFSLDPPPRNLSSDSIARELKAFGPNYQAFLLTQPHLYANYGTVRYLAGDEIKDLNEPDEILPLDDAKGLLVIALPERSDTLADIQGRIPGGSTVTRADKHERPMYTVYFVDQAEVPAPVGTTSPANPGWALVATRFEPVPDRDGLRLTGEVINETGAPQALAALTGTFYDAQGQAIAFTGNINAHWPVEVVPPGGHAPFELLVTGLQNAAAFDVRVDASAVDKSPRQVFRFFDLEQWQTDGAYCVKGGLHIPGEALQEYLVIAVVLYDSEGAMINFTDVHEPYPGEMESGQAHAFELCVDPPNHDVARYEVQAWGE